MEQGAAGREVTISLGRFVEGGEEFHHSGEVKVQANSILPVIVNLHKGGKSIHHNSGVGVLKHSLESVQEALILGEHGLKLV